MINRGFLKEVLTGKKALLKMSEVKFCNAPLFDEIGVKALYAKVIKLDGMNKYFPDKYPKGSQCCRSYMYNIWNSIHPEDVRQVIAHANKQRYSLEAEKMKQDAIVITEEWQRELESMPFVSK